MAPAVWGPGAGAWGKRQELTPGGRTVAEQGERPGPACNITVTPSTFPVAGGPRSAQTARMAPDREPEAGSGGRKGSSGKVLFVRVLGFKSMTLQSVEGEPQEDTWRGGHQKGDCCSDGLSVRTRTRQAAGVDGRGEVSSG